MDVQDEARRLHALYAGRDADLVNHLSSQIGTVKTYAQVLVGLCGLTVTRSCAMTSSTPRSR